MPDGVDDSGDDDDSIRAGCSGMSANLLSGS
jgi:hypothetical protein